jgi:hypothetical protein
MLTIENLEKCFESAINANYQYIGIVIHKEGFIADEVIINPSVNFEKWLEYLKNTYDKNLNHKYSKGISIAGFTYADTYEEIENMLV